MAQAMDAHSSFAYLVDNLPKWRASVELLYNHAAKKNAEFVAEYDRLVHQAKPKHKKSPSVSSIHTTGEQDPVNDKANAAEGVDTSSPDPRLINPLEAGNRYLYAQARRKRKPGPSIRSGASGPQKFRNRNHVVVYYDSYLQEQLDAMVKQIGLGRNNLRKGKNALAAATGFRLPALPSIASPTLFMLGDVRPSVMSRSMSALLSTKNPVAPDIQSTPEEATFVRTDKELEQIQSLCETAAHQFLRDGECKAELDGIRQKLDALVVQATMTAESLKKFQESLETIQDDLPSSDSNHGSASDGALSSQPSLSLGSTPKTGVAKNPSPFKTLQPLDGLKPQGFSSAPVVPTLNGPNPITAGAIEVDDDSDQESIVVDLSQYRLTNPRRIRA